jgi:hypothetical protein
MQKLAIYLANDSLVQRAGLVYRWDQNVWRVWGRSTWDETEVEGAAFSLGAIVFQTEISAILACRKDCIERNYTEEPGNFASP